MLPKVVFFGLNCFLVLPACIAQTPAATPASDNYRREAIVFERSETTYRMRADGTGERDIHVLIRIQSEGAAQQFGVLSFSYASANETPTIKMVRVHKPDGATVDTPVSDAIEMPADVTREAPLYSDLKEKHIPVRSLSAGDTLEYEVNTAINKPDAPGQFWGTMHFSAPGTIVVLAEVLNLEVPLDKFVQVWSPNHKATIADHDGLRTYTWNVPQLLTAPRNTGDETTKPIAPKDPDEDSDGRKLPSVAWTTFHSWAEVGEWYRSLASARAEPNDELRKRADEITKDAKTPAEQVQAIYDFVSTNTRYVGIDFGIGRYQPHPAAEVMANRYGDCKDKDTLLEALLRAKGFSTAPALVGVGIAPVPEVPSPAVFNHVITTVGLHDGRIWLDSTPPGAPYRYLTALIRDQKALVIPADSPSMLDPTPSDAPYPFTGRFEATATLDADGKLTSKMVATYRDDDEVLVRALARSVAPADWDKVSQYISSNTGFGGTTSDTEFKNAADSSLPMVVEYDYSRHPFGDWDNLRIVPLFPVLEFTGLSSDSIAPTEDIQLGAPRTLTAVSRIRLPEGFHTDLPDPIHVKTNFATFDKTYRFDGNEILAERNIVVLKNKIPKADWKQYLAFTKDISLEGEAWIQLVRPSKLTIVQPSEPTNKSSDQKQGTITLRTRPTAIPDTNPTGAPDAGATDDASIADLQKLAQDRMNKRDWNGARDALDKIATKSPNQRGLWAMYGFIAEVQNRDYEEAKKDFRKEMELQPDNPSIVNVLALVESKSGDTDGARHTLQQFLDRHPENLQLSLYLGSLETSANDYEGALKTYQNAANQNPDDKTLRIEVCDALVHLDRKEEAATALKNLLDGADDPMLLNNAAFILSETGKDLDIAEDASRKSIAKLEEKSAAISTAEANSNAFAQADTLIASWDTLGWILFLEGKLDAAESEISPAWRASLRADVGDHLGQVYEAMGKKNDALTTYALAQAANLPPSKPAPADIRKHIDERIARLKAAGAKQGSIMGTVGLQTMRTYHVERPAAASGWGTYRLEISSAGVIESQQMSGDQHIASVKPLIDQLKFPELLPPNSKAHLLRSAVVSCSIGKKCDVVLVPDGGLQTEQQ